MKQVRDIYREKSAAGKPVISFEFFPPKTAEGERNFLSKTVPALQQLGPDFCSVTYGAGGTTRHKTLAVVDQIQREHSLPAVAHLTCVGSTRQEIDAIAQQAHALGIHDLLALRGDPPAGMSEFPATAGGFTYAHELVEFLKELGGFCVGVAGFPEGHTACQEGKQVDWQRLKAKIDCGADYVLTQLFFDNRHFFEFRDYLTRLGVTVPIVPGIIPILTTSQIKKFTALCGATLPEELRSELDRLGDDAEATARFGVDYASRQCAELLEQGSPGLHFYTLNKAHSTTQILRNLGLGQG